VLKEFAQEVASQ
jgi:hypothetical protein